MAQSIQKHLSIGNSEIFIHDFVNEGDILPLHDHTPENVHFSIIARGSFTISGGPNTWSISAKTGDILDFQPGNPHEFISLEPNSRLVNITKGAKSNE